MRAQVDHFDISVVIPAYNASLFIERCLTSIIAQSKVAREIIVVNDGSTDNTAEILQKFSKNYKHINCINIKNSGVANARDTGVANANCEYVWFVDADDELMPFALENIYNNANQSDMTVCGYHMCFNKISSARSFYKENKLISGDDFVLKMLNAPNAFYYGVVWNKLYKRNIILDNNIKFDSTVTWGEDFIFNMNYLCYCNSVNIVSKSVYKYYRNTPGLTLKSLKSIMINPIFNSKIKVKMYTSYKDMLKKRNLYSENKNKSRKFMFSMTIFD